MKILMVEDEPRSREYLRQGLRESSLALDLAVTGLDRLPQALACKYDLIILDPMPPGADGSEILQRLRERDDTPLLVLARCDAIDDGARGPRALESREDDCLVKPLVDLATQLRTLLRHGPPPDIECLRIEDMELDLTRLRVTRAGQRIGLTPREFALLQFLTRRHGKVVSRAQIASHVWNASFRVDTNVVDVAVRRLRAKMDEKFSPKLIHSVRGIGYVLEKRTS